MLLGSRIALRKHPTARACACVRTRSYAIICGVIILFNVLSQPSLLIVAGLCGGLFAVAVEWGDANPVPGLNQPLALEQRMAGAAFASAAIVHTSGTLGHVSRVVLLCAGLTLGHAAFRARSLAARWSFFKEELKVD